ncbi:MAG: hypothetical protein ACI399_01405 [Candidatus Cryptobacteroides sp.]
MNSSIRHIFLICLSAALLLSCKEEASVEFAVSGNEIVMGPEGGKALLDLSADSEWIVKTQEPWITVSPANGIGSTECRIIVDSALTVSPREGLVRIERLSDGQRKDIQVRQEGFNYEISVEKQEVEIESYADYGSRTFSLEVTANTPFKVVIPEDPENNASWLRYTMRDLVLDRGARPRKTRIDFEWDINVYQQDRELTVTLEPTESEISLARLDRIGVRQKGAEPIEIGIKGDSLAIIAIHRALGCMGQLNTAERLANWDNVTVWKSGPNKGRVRSANFYLFAVKEGLPFQVQYLTAAESLYFFGNANAFLYDLDPGEYICKLTQLRKLTIGAYGLSSLPEEFTNLVNLEYLDLSGNNFQSVPDILNKENFPKMTALLLNSNIRYSSYDLSNFNRDKIGGLIDECPKDDNGKRHFPLHLLKWDSLDTLRLSVNFIQGTLPSLEDDDSFPRWTEAEVNACDTLPSRLIGLPKVLPNTDMFAINLNRLTGELPDWLLFHPKLDIWIPFSLVFPQDGKDQEGNSCGFTNEPANLDYYYEEYVNKKYNPNSLNQ